MTYCALILWVGQQEAHLACKKPAAEVPVGSALGKPWSDSRKVVQLKAKVVIASAAATAEGYWKDFKTNKNLAWINFTLLL